jgi:hypothetical protein
MIIPLISFIVISCFEVTKDATIDNSNKQHNWANDLLEPPKFEPQNLVAYNDYVIIEDIAFVTNDFNPTRNAEKSVDESNTIFLKEINNKFSYPLSFTNQPKIELGILLENVENGLKIIDIIKGSPCEKAGFERGDVFTKFNNTLVTNSRQLADNFRGIAFGTNAVISYIKKDQNTEGSMTVSKVRLADGGISLVFEKIKIVTQAPTPIEKEKNSSRNEVKTINIEALDKVSAYVPRTVKDKLGNTTTYVTNGLNDDKVESGLKSNNAKEAQEILEKIKNGDKQTLISLAQSGNIPSNLAFELKNSTSLREVLNKLENSGIKVDENMVQNYMQNNSKPLNFNSTKLAALIPASFESLFGNYEEYRPRNTTRKRRIGDPNASSYIKRLEALNRDDNGRKSGLPKDAGISSFNYTRSPNAQNPTFAGDSNSTKVSSKDFIPATVKQSNTNTYTGTVLSTNSADANAKPVFIPSVKPVEKKVGETFKSNDFVPAPQMVSNQNSTGKNISNGSNPNNENLQATGNLETKDKPVFIAAKNTFNKEYDESTRVINEIRAKLNADLNANNKKQQAILEKNNIDSKTESQKNKSVQEKGIANETTNVKIPSNPTVKQNDQNKADSKVVTENSTLDKSINNTDKSTSIKGIEKTTNTIKVDSNQSNFNNNAKYLSEKKFNTEKTDSNIVVKPATKPVFIPENKKIANKDEKKYTSSDFIPVSDLTKNDKSKVDAKDFKVSGENSTSVTNEKSTSKPQFIPSTKPQDREASELERILKEMKSKVNTTLSTEKAKNATTSNNLENKGELSKEKTIKENNNKTSKPLLLKFSIATIEKSERITLEIPKIIIDSSLVTNSIYYVPEKDRINNINWLWLNNFILN